MSFYITGTELRKALVEIELAEKNGFMFCRAILVPKEVDEIWIGLSYSDLWEKAHPTDGNFDWGRFQGVSKRNKFRDGKLVKLTAPKKN